MYICLAKLRRCSIDVAVASLAGPRHHLSHSMVDGFYFDYRVCYFIACVDWPLLYCPGLSPNDGVQSISTNYSHTFVSCFYNFGNVFKL